jgi:hypothetical protein
MRCTLSPLYKPDPAPLDLCNRGRPLYQKVLEYMLYIYWNHDTKASEADVIVVHLPMTDT